MRNKKKILKKQPYKKKSQKRRKKNIPTKKETTEGQPYWYDMLLYMARFDSMISYIIIFACKKIILL